MATCSNLFSRRQALKSTACGFAYLAAAGIGKIGIADADVVDMSNLQRQVIHFTKDLNVPKVDSAAEKMRAIRLTVVHLCPYCYSDDPLGLGVVWYRIPSNHELRFQRREVHPEPGRAIGSRVHSGQRYLFILMLIT